MGLARMFVGSFPTATILYLMLVLLTELNFDWGWLLFALIIDVFDDFIGKAV